MASVPCRRRRSAAGPAVKCTLTTKSTDDDDAGPWGDEICDFWCDELMEIHGNYMETIWKLMICQWFSMISQLFMNQIKVMCISIHWKMILHWWNSCGFVCHSLLMWFTDETGAFFDVDDVDLIERSYSYFPHELINLFDYSCELKKCSNNWNNLSVESSLLLECAKKVHTL